LKEIGMETLETTEKRLLAEIEALRLQYPDTQDLYREVCVVLFFRHGITPTANKLYQLVRKGSMSAPADALNRFWEMLREKSRMRIEHPDLPESLRDAAGEMVGALWQRAQAEAKSTLHALQEEAEASIQVAQSAAEDTLQKLARCRDCVGRSSPGRNGTPATGERITGKSGACARGNGGTTAPD
jgi:hypothetical protein